MLSLISSVPTMAKSNNNNLQFWNTNSTQKLITTRISCSRDTDQQLNLSVLRFTLGIPGLDESYLPRYIGYTFGGLLLLNHFLASSITPPQLIGYCIRVVNGRSWTRRNTGSVKKGRKYVLICFFLNCCFRVIERTEALGVSLAAFSAFVPYFGKFLKGSSPTDKKSIPEDADQIFVMSKDVGDTVKEDLAWGTYVLLRNTNSISVLVSVQDAVCVRGYWNAPNDVSKENLPDWFRKQIQGTVFPELTDTTYFTESTEISAMLPDGTRSLLVQPIMRAQKEGSSQVEKSKGFVLLASSIDYAYNDKDRSWITAISNKFGG